jgi:PAS domain S-box-containing protein
MGREEVKMVKPFRILIIEDDSEHVELIRRGFRRHDEFFLDFVSTGEEGLERLAKNSYDLISVDLILPGIGGLDVLIRIRKVDRDVPVVMVSGQGTTEMAVVAFENRATKYVVKSLESFMSLPYVFENLIQVARFKATERKMREQIKRSERIYRKVVENALAGIYILQDGVFKLANPKLGEIFGCSTESLIGAPFWHLVKPEQMDGVSRLGGEKSWPVYEMKVARTDGTARWVEFRTVPIEYEGQRAVLGNLVDITRWKESEAELFRKNKELMALNNIMMRLLHPSPNADKDLADSLADVLSAVSGADVGGIFLREKAGLVLRSLQGPVEELMEFIKDVDSGFLLAEPKVHLSPGQKTWISSPILLAGQPKGAMVVRLEKGDAEPSLSFLKRAAEHLSRLTELCSSAPLQPAPTAELHEKAEGVRLQG